MTYPQHQIIQILMGFLVFAAGLSAIAVALGKYLFRKNSDSVSKAYERSVALHSKAVVDVNLAPSLDSLAQLLNAISQMLRENYGVGVFLCINGTVLCVLGYLMVQGVSP